MSQSLASCTCRTPTDSCPACDALLDEEPYRIIRLIVLASGQIHLWFDGVPALTYSSWAHWFAAGITAYADHDLVFVQVRA